jgi:hypothetical protein
VQSAPLAFLSAVLIIFGISDLVSVSMPEDIARYHWGTQGLSLLVQFFFIGIANLYFAAPVRLALFFALTIYSFLFSASSPLSGSSRYTPSQWGGEGLKNRVLFTWAFLELITWFWIFVTLREERREGAAKETRRRMAQEETM